MRDAGEGLNEASLLLEGVRCSACLWLIEEMLRRLPGVESMEVNFVTHRAVLRWHPGAVRLSGVLQTLGKLGYGAHPYRPQQIDALQRTAQRQWLWRLFVAGFGMMQVMMYAVPVYVAGAGDMLPEYEALMRWASFVLTVPVVFYSAQPFFSGAWRGMHAGRLGMDFPVALGIAIAFIASTWATLHHEGEVYFDSLTMFIFLLLFGRYLEMLARNAAGRSLSHLARLTPMLAERLHDFAFSRESERVPVAQLTVGDVLVARPGEAIAADGVVIEGCSAVDEALLSGESMPLAKSPGSVVVGGSINIENPLFIRVQRVGAASTLASIVRLVEHAAAQKQPLAQMADRYAQKFVWLILAASVVAAVAWLFIDPSRATWIAISLLVATCPCALSLATPVALTTATGNLARHGMIVTQGHTIESLARATDFVFDKTGTLTDGRLSVLSFTTKGSLSRDECLAIAEALERASAHPIGKAVHAFSADLLQGPAVLVDAAGQRDEAGAGIEALIAGRRYRLGNFEFCAALSQSGDVRHLSNVETVCEFTRIWLAREGEILARFDLSDRIKEGALELVASLKAAGRKVHLVSGDALGPVMRIAQQLDIDAFRGSTTPAGKQAYVEALQRDGAHVAMIGDGVNDAPVLARADVSVAMGDGALLAQTHADAVLMSGAPRDLQKGLRLAERTLGVIHQNLAWAFAYNLAVMPLAAAGLVNPWLAGLGMSVSSLLVVMNALRLKRLER